MEAKICSDEAVRLVLMFREVYPYLEELKIDQQRQYQESMALVNMIESTRQKWLASSNECEGLKTVLTANEEELKRLRADNTMVCVQVKELRAHVTSLVTAKQSLETQLRQYERRFELVGRIFKTEISNLPKESRLDLAFLNDENGKVAENGIGNSERSGGPSLSGSEANIDYDNSADPLEDDELSVLRSGRPFRGKSSAGIGQKRHRSRSGSHHHQNDLSKRAPIAEQEQLEKEECPEKRSKNGHGGAPVDVDIPNDINPNEIVTTTEITVDPKGVRPSHARISIGRRLTNRSFSESQLDLELANAKMGLVNTGTRRKDSLLGSADNLLSTPRAMCTWTNGGAIGERGHTFVPKTAFLREFCDVCSKRIGFGSTFLRCTDCRTSCHEQCRSTSIVPCVPRQVTPKTPIGTLQLAHFCPPKPPMVPHIIIHCVLELERHHLASEGLYRVPGSMQQVQELLNRFKSDRGVPNLAIHFPDTITGVIKKFLGDLRDRLIPASSWKEFVRAVENESEEQLNRCIADLPMPNRDTLAFLCAHWQRVAEMAEVNKMPLTNLARVLGPTVVGPSYSATASSMSLAGAGTNAQKQSTVLMGLLGLPREYWERYLTFATARLYPSLSPDLGERSILGPVTPAARFRATNKNTPRSANTLLIHQRSTKKPYFTPVWK